MPCPLKPWTLLTRVFVYSHVPCVCLCPQARTSSSLAVRPLLSACAGFFVLGSRLVLGSGLAVPACALVCKCLAFVPSPLDPLLLQVHRLPRWRMPRPCSVLLLCSGFRVVLGFLVWGLLVFACLCALASGCQCLVVLPLYPACAASRSWHFVVLPRLELRHRCPLFIDFFLGSDPRPRRGCSSWLYLALLAPALCWGCVKVRVLWAWSSLRPYGPWPPGSLPQPFP